MCWSRRRRFEVRLRIGEDGDRYRGGIRVAWAGSIGEEGRDFLDARTYIRNRRKGRR